MALSGLNAGQPLVLPDGLLTRLDAAQAELLQCYRVHDPEHVRHQRSHAGETWRNKDVQVVSVTAKGAGGTGKTTTTWNTAAALVISGEDKAVMVVNVDSQHSLEERLLGKLVNEVYDGDFAQLYALNNMHSTVLTSLRTMLQGPGFRLVPPRVLSVDPIRLAAFGARKKADSGKDSGKRIFIMRSDENMAEWDQQLSESRILRHLPGGSIHKAVPGALYNLMKMSAYVFNVPCVVVDIGPGNSRLNRTVMMSSNGWCMPLSIDNKSHSTINSMASSLPVWMAEYEETLQQTAGGDNKYPLPNRMPKFLGVIFSRLGARGAVRPYNQYAALLRCYERISNALMPAVTACNMALPNPYQTYSELVSQVVLDIGQGAQAAPGPVPGVVGVLREFDALQYMSERESVPVPCLQRQHFKTMQDALYDQYLNQLQANPNLPVPPDSQFLQPVGDVTTLNNKVANIRAMTDIFRQVITDNRKPE